MSYPLIEPSMISGFHSNNLQSQERLLRPNTDQPGVAASLEEQVPEDTEDANFTKMPRIM